MQKFIIRNNWKTVQIFIYSKNIIWHSLVEIFREVSEKSCIYWVKKGCDQEVLSRRISTKVVLLERSSHRLSSLVYDMQMSRPSKNLLQSNTSWLNLLIMSLLVTMGQKYGKFCWIKCQKTINLLRKSWKITTMGRNIKKRFYDFF